MKSVDPHASGLGLKWYVYFTHIHPWIQIYFLITAIKDYISTDVGLVCFVLELIFELVLFFKAINKSPNLLGFIKAYLIVSFCKNIVYTSAIPLYEGSGLSSGEIAAAYLIFFILWYFVWYRVNIGYFRRRLVHSEPESSHTEYKSDNQKGNYIFETPEDVAAYSEGMHFKCEKCGTYYRVISKKCNVCQAKDHICAIKIKKASKTGAGDDLSNDIRTSEKIHTPNLTQMPQASENHPNFCAECGAKLSEGNKFCANCGAKVVNT